ncbi:hypothetical protein Tco_1398930 [Tanacetum coccineum]
MQMGVGKGKGILNVKMNPLSHDDQAATMANGFKVVARSEQGAVAAIECGARRGAILWVAKCMQVEVR